MESDQHLPPLEEGARGAVEGVGEDAAAAMPPPLEHEEALFTGSPEPVPLEDVEQRITEQKSRIEESSSEEPG